MSVSCLCIMNARHLFSANMTNNAQVERKYPFTRRHEGHWNPLHCDFRIYSSISEKADVSVFFRPLGMTSKFRGIYIVKIGILTPSPIYLYRQISLFQWEKRNSLVKKKNLTLIPCLVEEFDSSTTSHLFRKRLMWSTEQNQNQSPLLKLAIRTRQFPAVMPFSLYFGYFLLI